VCIKNDQGQLTKFGKFATFIKPVLEGGLAGAGVAQSPGFGAAFGQGFLGAQQFRQQREERAEQKMMREQQARTSGLQETLLKSQVAEARKTPEQRLAEEVARQKGLLPYRPTSGQERPFSGRLPSGEEGLFIFDERTQTVKPLEAEVPVAGVAGLPLNVPPSINISGANIGQRTPGISLPPIKQRVQLAPGMSMGTTRLQQARVIDEEGNVRSAFFDPQRGGYFDTDTREQIRNPRPYFPSLVVRETNSEQVIRDSEGNYFIVPKRSVTGPQGEGQRGGVGAGGRQVGAPIQGPSGEPIRMPTEEQKAFQGSTAALQAMITRTRSALSNIYAGKEVIRSTRALQRNAGQLASVVRFFGDRGALSEGDLRRADALIPSVLAAAGGAVSKEMRAANEDALQELTAIIQRVNYARLQGVQLPPELGETPKRKDFIPD
jgi:hypothetical protein